MSNRRDENNIRNRATVTVSKTVDGTRPQYRRSRREPAQWTRNERVSETLMAAARAAQRPGEKLVVINSTEVRLVPM